MRIRPRRAWLFYIQALSSRADTILAWEIKDSLDINIGVANVNLKTGRISAYPVSYRQLLVIKRVCRKEFGLKGFREHINLYYRKSPRSYRVFNL